MSRYQPVYLRHKRTPAHDKETSRNVAVLGLRIAAMLCWVAAVFLCVSGVLGVMDSARAGSAFSHWEPLAMMAGAVGALIVGWRIWALKRWACIVAVAAALVVCLLEPWRPSHYPGAVIDVAGAIAASLIGCVVFVVPLIVACMVARTQLRSGV